MMNKVQEITRLVFIVSGKPINYSCVSGRLKYDDLKFSLKCRVDGGNGIDEVCEQAESIEVHTNKEYIIFSSISELKLAFESVSVSVLDRKSNSQYLVQGKGSSSNA